MFLIAFEVNLFYKIPFISEKTIQRDTRMTKHVVPMAIAYDLDETLAVKNMLTYILPVLKMDSAEFLDRLSHLPQEVEGDLLLICFHLLHKQAKELGIPLTREMLHSFGKYLEPFPGLPEYFPRINEYARKRGVSLEHFIISSNSREVIEGTCIAPYFSRIYASAFIFDEDGIACWPALLVNYTMKTQFLFRINKGCRDVYDDAGLNAEIGDKRAIPFTNIVFVGDGETDIPCMHVARKQGGYAFAVYNPEIPSSVEQGKRLFKEGRVDRAVPADYSENSDFDKEIKAIIDSLAPNGQ